MSHFVQSKKFLEQFHETRRTKLRYVRLLLCHFCFAVNTVSLCYGCTSVIIDGTVKGPSTLLSMVLLSDVGV